MAIKAKIRLSNLPFKVEHFLCVERGFHLMYRINGQETVVLQKGYLDKPSIYEAPAPWNDDDIGDVELSSDDGKPYGWEPKTTWEIPKWRTDILEKKCDKVVNLYMDPYHQLTAITEDLHKMCAREGFSEVECEWVENWIYTNVY